MNFIVNAFTDGTDFIGQDGFRPIGQRCAPRGFGDMICQISNLNAQTDSGNVLTSYINPAFNIFNSLLLKKHQKHTWINNRAIFEQCVSMASNNEELCKITDRKFLHSYPDYEYIKLDKSKFINPDGWNEKPFSYATAQSVPFAQKCKYDLDEIQNIYKKFGIKIIEVSGKEDLGLLKLAYIIHNAQFHLGIDSGMTHFALTIKDKKDVKIFIPKKRITGVGKRWIDAGGDVTLI